MDILASISPAMSCRSCRTHSAGERGPRARVVEAHLDWLAPSQRPTSSPAPYPREGHSKLTLSMIIHLPPPPSRSSNRRGRQTLHHGSLKPLRDELPRARPPRSLLPLVAALHTVAKSRSLFVHHRLVVDVVDSLSAANGTEGIAW